MRSFPSSALRATLACIFFTSHGQAQNSTSSSTSASAEPCALISEAVADGAVYLDASIAMACLQSVPVDVDGDIAEIDGLKLLFQFQSDLAYLKDPPTGFLYPGVDVIGSLDDIQSKLQAGEYISDYDVQIDLYNLVTSTYDFHFNWVPDLVGAFAWNRHGALISVSKDGLSLPEVYDYRDRSALATPNASDYKPSPVIQIDGVDVEAWINEFAALNPWDHDRDANYNNVLVNVPLLSIQSGGTGSYQVGTLYQGNETVLSFANGTTRNVEAYATLGCQSSLSGVTDGPSFYQQCRGGAWLAGSQKRSPTKRQDTASPVTTQNAYTPVPTTNLTLDGPPTYPQPFVAASDYSISGYFPDNQPDLVVLSCPNLGPASSVEFENVLRSILATAKSAGKSKLLIDLRGNGGGTVLNGYDTFKQLFPAQTPYGVSNLAAFGLLDAAGETDTYQVAIGNLSDGDLGAWTDFDVVMDLTTQLTDFDSWSSFYGPEQRHGGNFTQLKRFNLSNEYSLGEPVYGYINDTRPQPQTFSPDDIVILSDAFCGSTCAVFAEFMKTQAGVQAISVGGRKQFGPMQWVGGSKGANDQNLGDLAQAAVAAAQVATPEQLELFEPYLNLTASVEPALSRLVKLTDGRVNFENNIRQGDDSVTPLQFVYEAADCRFFYTAPMLEDQTLVWKRAHDLRWANGTCVQGSTGHPSSVSGAGSSYIDSYPPAGANNTFGGNDTFSYPGAFPYSSTILPSPATTNAPASESPTASGTATTSPAASQSVQPYTGAAHRSAAGSLMATLIVTIVGTFALA